jgi:peptidoglycan/LPS O-acetylase OafA/YrhL
VVAAALAGTAVAVTASWTLVERPVLSWSRRRRDRRVTGVAPAMAPAGAG